LATNPELSRRQIDLLALLSLIAVGLLAFSGPRSRTASSLPSPPAGYSGSTFEWYYKQGKDLYQRGYALESHGQRELAYRTYGQSSLYYAEARRHTQRRGEALLEILEDQAWVEVCHQQWAAEEPFRRELLEIRQASGNKVMLAQAHYELARCLQRQKKFKASRKEFILAIELRDQTGSNWVYYDNYAVLLREMGLAEEAAATTRKAQELRALAR
jgi:tetratricopeptide (TPR) repeat protein